MKRVATGVILAALVLGASFFAPDWAFILLIGLAATFGIYEYLEIANHHARTYEVLTIVYVAVEFAVFSLLQKNDELLSHFLIVIAVTASVVYLLGLFFLGFRKPVLNDALPSAALSFFGVFYVALPLFLVVIVRFLPAGRFFLLYLFAAVWTGDIAAFYVGRSWGRHKLAPRISPNKTWEGAIASIVFSVAITLILVRFSTPIIHYLENDALSIRVNYFQFALFTVLLNVAAQFGDLVESMLKRGAGVKDSGKLLPGHGGVLDRIDALLFASPVAMLLFTFASRNLLEKAS